MKFTQSEIAGLYSEGNAQGATPLGLVVALYDTILRDLRRANDAIAQKNVEKRTFEMNHALRVIAELENVLDFERGGKPATQLKSFYAVTRKMILDAGIRNSREAVDQLIEMFGTLRQAWHDADSATKSTPTSPEVTAPLPAPATVARPRLRFEGADAAADMPRSSWRA